MVIVLANKVAYHKITIPVSAYISDKAMFPNTRFYLVLIVKLFVLIRVFSLNELICIRKSFYNFIMLFVSLGPHVHKITNQNEDVLPSIFFCTNQICFRYVQCPLSIYQKSYSLTEGIDMPNTRCFFVLLRFDGNVKDYEKI